MDNFTEKLRSRGFRATPGRIALLRALWSAKSGLTVGELSEKLDLNFVTVYRALHDLAEQGLVMRGVVTGDMRAMHFSYPKGMHHHHLVCSDCGFTKQCVTC